MHLAVVVDGSSTRLDELVAKALVVPLEMVVRDELEDGGPEVVLAEDRQAVEALLADRAHEALRERVQVRTPREADHWNPSTVEKSSERRRVDRIAAEDQEALVAEEAIDLSMRLRPICIIHRPHGWWTMPATWTRRVSSSITKKTK